MDKIKFITRLIVFFRFFWRNNFTNCLTNGFEIINVKILLWLAVNLGLLKAELVEEREAFL